MDVNGNSKITLIGSTDGKEKRNSGERKNLARQRAQSIKDILVNNWNVDPERISVQSRDLPKVTSNKEYLEGDAENRRVEIESDNPEILSPVVYSTFNEYVPLQNKVSCSIDIDTIAEIDNWSFEIAHKGKSLHTSSGSGAPSSAFEIPLDSAIISALGNRIENNQDSVDIVLSFLDKKGDKLKTETKQAIKNTQNTFEISRLSLIVFEYDESTLSEKNARMMKDFLSKEIGPDSRIDITGSTDKLGEITYNITLSEERAKAVETFMRSVQSNLNITSVKGIGSSRMLFDNALPEGRYYCRTVSIEVKNPIQSLPGK
jgi:outer membrane protein OmpA-like peptidoglycan-associated protein